MTQFQIKKGYKRYLIDENNNPLIEIEEGCWYLTLDTTEVFVAINGQLKPLNQADINLDEYDDRFDAIEARLDALEARAPEKEVNVYVDKSQFPTVGSADVIYVDATKHASYVYHGNEYLCIGTESSEIDIEIINGGKAKVN